MCTICDGATADEVLSDIHSHVTRTGFAQVPVDHDDNSWTYTIGLAARAHPELVLAGVKLDAAIDVVDRLAWRVLDGERFDNDDDSISEGRDLFLVRSVHPWHLEHGLFGAWNAYYDARPDPPPLTALQVVPPATWFCRCHANSQPRLDLPRLYGTPRPNREARRRRARRRRVGHSGW